MQKYSLRDCGFILMISAVCFLAILRVIGFLTGIYSIGYMRHKVAHGEL